MNPAQRDRAIASLKDAIATLERMPVTTPCTECMHLCHDSGVCGKWNAQVPEHALATGCDQWEEDIPF